MDAEVQSAQPTQSEGSQGQNLSTPPPQSNSGAVSQPQVGQTAPETPEEQFIRITVHGKQKEIPYKDAIRRLQQEDASLERFEKAAMKEKELQAERQRLISDPFRFLADQGQDVQSLLQEYVKNQALFEQMSPEEQALAQKRQELEEIESKLAEHQRMAEEQEINSLSQQFQEKLEGTIMETLEKNPQIPKSAQAVSRFAFYMQRADEAGMDWDMDVIAERVAGDFRREIGSVVTGMGTSDLMDYLGQEKVEAIVQAYYAQHRPQAAQPQRTLPQSRPAESKKQIVSSASVLNQVNRD